MENCSRFKCLRKDGKGTILTLFNLHLTRDGHLENESLFHASSRRESAALGPKAA